MLVHWDEVEPEVIDQGDLRGTRWRLGAAAGASRTGLSRYRLGPGERAMPVHVHGDEEELFYVLAGEGLSWQDGRTYAVRAGDCILHLPGAEAHTIAGAGDGLDVLAFGSGSDTGATWLPRAGAMWLNPHWLPLDGPDPFAARGRGRAARAAGARAGPAADDRRARRRRAERGAPRRRRRAAAATSARALGSVRIGAGQLVVEPRMLSSPPHCHSAEEELFVVLDGSGTLLLGDDEHPVRPGSIVARPPGSGVSHAFRAGDAGLTLLAFGTRDPNDIVYYPRSGKVSLRGVRARFRVERVGYWDGEPG